MSAAAAGAVAHPGFSVTAMILLGAGLAAFAGFGLACLLTGWDAPAPGWVSPLCGILSFCGLAAAVLGVCAQVALWLGIT